MVALHSDDALAVCGVCGPVEARVDFGLLRGSGCPGESLAGAGRPTATVPVGVAILLGGVVGNLTAGSSGSSTSGENLDPAAWSGGSVVLNVVPLFRVPS